MKELIRQVNRIIAIAIIVLTMIAIAFTLPEEELTENIKIGVTDDISGFVVDYITVNKKSNIEAYFVKDC